MLSAFESALDEPVQTDVRRFLAGKLRPERLETSHPAGLDGFGLAEPGPGRSTSEIELLELGHLGLDPARRGPSQPSSPGAEWTVPPGPPEHQEEWEEDGGGSFTGRGRGQQERC